MAFFDLIGYRSFASEQDIRMLVRESEHLAADASLRTLLIFSTSKQHTWLVATPVSLVCVLDDVRKEVPRIQWSMPIDQAKQAEIAARSSSERSGLLDIGPRTNWYYSKRLFAESGIIESVQRLINPDDFGADRNYQVRY